MKAALYIALLAIWLAHDTAADETVDSGRTKQLALANAYDLVCPQLQLSRLAREYAASVLAHGEEPDKSSFAKATADRLAILVNRPLEQICEEGKSKFGREGSLQQGWISESVDTFTLEVIVAGLDTELPDTPTRQILRALVIVGQVRQRCPNVEMAIAVIDALAKARITPQDLDPGGKFGVAFLAEQVSVLRWIEQHDTAGTAETDTWFCREALARYGPSGWVKPHYLIPKR